VATADARPVTLPDGLPEPEIADTPGLTTVAEVAQALHVEPGTLLKAYPVIVEDRGLTMVVVRGDHRVNDIKLTNALGATFRPAREEEFAERIGPTGYIGPVNIDVPILLDDAVEPGAYVTGANRENAHLRGVEPGRDFPFKRGDVRNVEPGDTVNGNPIRIEPAIEVGNIFKLGTRYSEPLGATYLDESGKSQPIWMGSYGLGPARITAAAIEQFADEKGISWPRALAPWDVEIVALGKPGSDELAAAEGLYRELRTLGLEVLLDDRDAGPGAKFADAELLGVPLRLTIGRRSLESGRVEAQRRRGLEDIEGGIPLEGAAEAVIELWRTLP
jgi:prolyl-tRNA synthetase